MTETIVNAKPVSADDLTLDQLTLLVGEASGWGDCANITYRLEFDRASSNVPRCSFVAASVKICGGEFVVSAIGADHRKALVALLQVIEMHHRGILRWHKQRCVKAREILDAHGVYYVKGDL